jgi:hypothetical protein
MSACIDTPISWLRLERYELGEVDEEERAAIAAHLGACEVCAACLASIKADTRELPSLEVTRRKSAVVIPWRRVLPAAGALAAAAAIVLIMRRPVTETPGLTGDRIKGNDIAFSLVHEGEGVADEAGTTYHDGERFKALVTCPPGMHATFDLVAYEGTEAAFPLEAQSDLECGNSVAMQGAFRMTGHEPMTVCLVWSDGMTIDRAAIDRTAPALLDHALCKALTPAR